VIAKVQQWLSLMRQESVALAVRFAVEDSAQDLVEYAFLAAFVATTGMLVLANLGTDINRVYNSWLDPTSGVPSLWDPSTSITSSGS
jgi:hypothetical protein